MAVDIAEIKRLRELTGVGMTDAKKALDEANGDFDKALAEMRKKGLTKAEKRGEREARAGIIGTYNHDSRIGVLVEVNCETDFVAKTEEFKSFVRDIAMQIAASKPEYVRREEIPAENVERERSILRRQALNEGKPEKIVDKMVEGRIEKFYRDVCLLEQPFIKNPDITVKQMLTEKVAKIGENINIRRFVRYELGEGIQKKQCDLAAEVEAVTRNIRK